MFMLKTHVALFTVVYWLTERAAPAGLNQCRTNVIDVIYLWTLRCSFYYVTWKPNKRMRNERKRTGLLVYLTILQVKMGHAPLAECQPSRTTNRERQLRSDVRWASSNTTSERAHSMTILICNVFKLWLVYAGRKKVILIWPVLVKFCLQNYVSLKYWDILSEIK